MTTLPKVVVSRIRPAPAGKTAETQTSLCSARATSSAPSLDGHQFVVSNLDCAAQTVHPEFNDIESDFQ